MIQDKKILALIPARGGSKRLPRKNVIKLAGKPLIAWSIDAARGSRYIDRVVVSTDDPEIASVGKQFGADIPFIRPSEFAADVSTTSSAILHALNVLDEPFDIVVILQPTSPLRSSFYVDKAVELFESKKADGVVSVCKCEHSPEWSGVLPKDQSMGSFIDGKSIGRRSQDIPEYHRLNGAIYVFDVEEFKINGGVFYNDSVYAYEMPLERSVDIDEFNDFRYAEFLLGVLG